MDSRLKLKRPILQVVFKTTLMSIALLMHIASAEIINQHSSTFQNNQNSNICCNHADPNFLNSTSNQLPNGAIQLQIIKNMVDHYAEVLLQPNHEYSHRYKGGNPSSPTSSSNSNCTLKIDYQISKLQNHLSYLNSSTSLSAEDKFRITEIETIIKDLRITLDDLLKEYAEKDCKKDQRIQNITQKLEASNILAIVQSINAGQFSFADEQLQLLTDDSIYKTIVQQVYLQHADTFDLLLRFGGSITDLERKFKVYETLYHIMKTNNRIDIQKLLQLSQSTRKGVYEVSVGFDSILEDNSRSFIRTLWTENEEPTNTLISSAYLENGSWPWPTIKQVNEEIRRSCGYKYLGDVHYKLFDKAWEKQPLITVLNVTHQFTIPEEQIIIHEKLYSRFKSDKFNDSKNLVILVGFMKATWQDPEFDSVDWRSRYKIIINGLPSSLKSIVLHSTVCLKFSHFDEYLYAEDFNEEYNITERCRTAFTWIPKDNKYKSLEFKWKLRYTSNGLWEILNVKYNQSLYARYNTNNYLNETNPVLELTSTERTWILHVDGDSVQLSYINDNYYLHANGKRNDRKRYVIAYNHASKPSYPLNWDITDCSDFP